MCAANQVVNCVNNSGLMDTLGSQFAVPGAQRRWKVRMSQPPPLFSALMTVFCRSASVQVESTSSGARSANASGGGTVSAYRPAVPPSWVCTSPNDRALLYPQFLTIVSTEAFTTHLRYPNEVCGNPQAVSWLRALHTCRCASSAGGRVRSWWLTVCPPISLPAL